MDVPTLTPAPATPPLAPSPACPECGYDRTGLPAAARCPECGEAASNATDDSAHWRVTAVGLLLLIVASIGALRVALVMPVGPLSLAAVNVPCPKVGAASLVQRTIGGHPGPWGVAGTVWVLLAIVGTWLITEPRSARGTEEKFVSLRKLARWWPIVTGGAALGILMSGVTVYTDPMGVRVAWVVALIVALCEFPSALLLYLHLRDVARRTGDRRSPGQLAACAWAVPIAVGLAALIVAGAAVARAAAQEQYEWSAALGRTGGGFGDLEWPTAFRAAMGAFGAVALGAGIAATAAVARLLALAAARGFGPWASIVRSRVHRVPEAVRGVVAVIAKEPGRWRVAAGVALLLWGVPGMIAASLGTSYRERTDLGGMVPLINFPGPKIAASPMIVSAALQYGGRLDRIEAGITLLAAVWLITSWARPGETNWARRLRRTARWFTIVAVGAVLGFALSGGSGTRGLRTNHLVTLTIVCVEAPATALLYWHLGVLAAAAGAAVAVSRGLKIGALVAPALMLAPLGFFIVHRTTFLRSSGVVPKWVPWSSAAYMAAALIVAFLAAAAMAAVVVRLLVRREEPAPVPENPDEALCRERNVDRPVCA